MFKVITRIKKNVIFYKQFYTFKIHVSQVIYALAYLKKKFKKRTDIHLNCSLCLKNQRTLWRSRRSLHSIFHVAQMM